MLMNNGFFTQKGRHERSRTASSKQRHYGRNFFAAVAAAFISAGVLFGVNVNAASERFISDDLPQAPSIGIRDVIEDDTSEDETFSPVTLNVTLSTGSHYNYLSAEEKILYEAIYKAVESGNYVKYKYLNNETEYDKHKYTFYTDSKPFAAKFASDKALGIAVNRAQEAVYYDHPDHVELYMCYVAYYGATKAKNNKYKSYIIMAAYADDSNFASYNASINNSLNTIVAAIKSSGATSTWSAFNELKAHDYYCSTYSLEYDDSCYRAGNNGYFMYAHTAYGSLVKGKAVCDGYSTGFELILGRLGIPAMVITGDGGTKTSQGGHAWNIVNLDGNWYEADTTWDDGESVLRHDFFNKTTEEYANGILNNYHVRTSNTGYVGFRMPVARGNHWTYNYLAAGNYTKDTNIWIIGISAPAVQNIFQGSTSGLSVNVVPANATNKNMVLTSSNPSVVSVSGNTVTGVSVGNAVVTIKPADGGVATSCTVSVCAPIGTEISYSGSKYVITGLDTVSLSGSSAGTVNILSNISLNGKNYSVTAIADNAFKNNSKVKSITGGKNLTSIGSNAFYGCKKLASIKLMGAANLKSIGKKSFYKCSKLTKIELNSTKLSKVGSNAFSKIKNAAKVTIKASSKSRYNKVVKLLQKAGAKKASYKKK